MPPFYGIVAHAMMAIALDSVNHRTHAYWRKNMIFSLENALLEISFYSTFYWKLPFTPRIREMVILRLGLEVCKLVPHTTHEHQIFRYQRRSRFYNSTNISFINFHMILNDSQYPVDIPQDSHTCTHHISTLLLTISPFSKTNL